jgi:CRP-like cAMP-binding protein
MLKGMDMANEPLDAHKNKLIARLPVNERQKVLSTLESVALRRDTVISEAGKPIEWVYFLTEGIGSVFLATPERNHAEAGIFGSEGYIPTSAVTDVDFSPFNVNIQIDALGYRMSYRDFQMLMETSRPFAKVMIRAIEAFAIQLAYTAVSNAVHDVNERLARWLLMCHDRVVGDSLALTHEFISLMLSVRRPSVTTSLHVLEGNGFIRAERGTITIRNRAALEDYAHDAYGKPEEEYRRLMEGLFNDQVS